MEEQVQERIKKLRDEIEAHRKEINTKSLEERVRFLEYLLHLRDTP
jgi:peptidoglycan hydrolase CwlO-like protein